MVRNDDYDRERPSWREIDRRRDRSRHVNRSRSESEKRFSSKVSKERYLKKLDKLFSEPKTKESDKQLEDLKKSIGTSSFNRKFKKFVTEFGHPEDWEILIHSLNHKDTKLVKRSMELLMNMAKDRPIIEKQGFRAKLEVLSRTTPDMELMELAQEYLEELLENA